MTFLSSKEGEYPALRYGAIQRQFRKPDIFSTTITSCNHGQKADRTQVLPLNGLSSPYISISHKGFLCMLTT